MRAFTWTMAVVMAVGVGVLGCAEKREEELPQIILWTEIDADAYNTRVEGVQATVNDIMTWNVADWKVVE